MAMMVRIERKGDPQGSPAGWLVMEYGERNYFVLDDGTMDEKQLGCKYGGCVKATIRVDGSEWRRFLSKVVEGRV